jgi:hypothetical protein
MSPLDYRRPHSARNLRGVHHLSGGTRILLPKTPVERLLLWAEQKRLKRDYLRREAVRREAH